MNKTIAIIPARGGSKGIPRKNLRPIAGKPLIYYSIHACVNAKNIDTVLVSTDDEEIALFASRFGAKVLMRPEDLANDAATLDPVIEHAADWAEKEYATKFDIILTVQPTSPLIKSNDINQALQMFENTSYDTVLSVVDDRHLCWTSKNGKIIPEYVERVNRQQLPTRFKETGAIIACKRGNIKTYQSRIGEDIGLFEVEQEKSFDIDTISDFSLCENLLLRKKIVFNIIGNSSIGLGHAYRALMIASELVLHDIVFITTDTNQLAADFIAEKNYKVIICENSQLLTTLYEQSPDVIINDILDTEIEFINALKSKQITVINFEDLGSGVEASDLVINALYSPSLPLEHIKSGPEYFCLRDEFLHLTQQENNQPEEVLLCFGGVDEGNLTCKTIAAIHDECKANNIKITAILGPGYQHNKELHNLVKKLSYEHLSTISNTSSISNYMQRATLAFTSGGRTVFELTALQTPTIVICQNDRELTHQFASSEQGIINLGHRDRVNQEEILNTFIKVIKTPGLRQNMLKKSSLLNLTLGKQKVINLIKNLMESRDA